MCKITPEYIKTLKNNEIFVFGSNEAGIHGAGAAKLALNSFGAIYKKGIGFQGNCYALPTKDFNIITLPLNKIEEYVNELYTNIILHPEYHFLITKVGCGLAGLKEEEIAPLFDNFKELSNVSLPESFINIINKSRIITVYKMTDENMKCRGFQYELNKKYVFKEKVSICSNGFHSCSTAQNCLRYYENNGKNRLFLCEVELNKNVSLEKGDNLDNFKKIATDNIKFIKELKNLSKEFNSGNRNSGNWNSGDWNSGNWNSGNGNSGHSNSGNWNSENWNSGNWNSGNRNSGNWNSGNWNSGNRNSGNFNTESNLRFFFNQVTNVKDENIHYPSWLFVNNYKSINKLDIKKEIQKQYNEASYEEQNLVENLPNYNADILFELFGIDRRNLKSKIKKSKK